MDKPTWGEMARIGAVLVIAAALFRQVGRVEEKVDRAVAVLDRIAPPTVAGPSKTTTAQAGKGAE